MDKYHLWYLYLNTGNEPFLMAMCGFYSEKVAFRHGTTSKSKFIEYSHDFIGFKADVGLTAPIQVDETGKIRPGPTIKPCSECIRESIKNG